MAATSLEQIVALAKRRGFVFPSNELYGGLAAVYDLGPLGVALKNRIKQLWWERFVDGRDDVVGIESAILTRREVLQASGHESNFSDPLVECKICHERFRADSPSLTETGFEGASHQHEFTQAKPFNLMFKTYAGPVEDSAAMVYLRPETAQGMFTNFKNVLDSTRVKVPFGIAQIGKSFRNEITTGTFVFRMREFEIAEIEYFVKPGSDDAAFTEWIQVWEKFFVDLGLDRKKMRRYEHPQESLAHYSKGTTDIEYEFSFGWGEIAGIANRTDFDLKEHQNHSAKDLQFFDQESNEKYLPFVIEPTLGVERTMFALLADAYHEEGEGDKHRMVLKLKPALAPYQVAVFPLLKNKPELVAKAAEVYRSLKKNFRVSWDDRGNIGKRYYAQDEIGTPYCVTIDFDTLEHTTVTIRDRDTMSQERVRIDELVNFIAPKLL